MLPFSHRLSKYPYDVANILWSFLFTVPPNIKLRLSVRGDTIKVMAGEPVNIPADVTGLPMPKIEWSKNETVIEKSTDALKITKEEVSRSEAKTEVIISKAVRQDKGTYTITASNRLGSVFRNVHVEVYGKQCAFLCQNEIPCLCKNCLLSLLFWLLSRSSIPTKKPCCHRH